MKTYKEALEIILSFSHTFGREKLPVTAVLRNRVLAEPVYSDRDYPPFNRATMDGYALNSLDLASGLSGFRIAGVIFAGAVTDYKLGRGECFKIMTGAMVPPEADLVIKKEDAMAEGNQVRFSGQDRPAFQYIARMGEDIRSGQLLIPAGLPFNSSLAGSMAVVGKTSAFFSRLPLVSLFSSGNEIVSIQDTPLLHQIRNSNSPMLASMLYDYGIIPAISTHFPDVKDDIKAGLSKAMDADLLILTGAVSAGDADFIPGCLKELGVEEKLYKVAIKPGKPLWFGVKPDGPVVFALPGNPVSAQVTFKLFVEPFLRQCLGLKPLIPVYIPMVENRSKRVPLDEFFLARLQPEPYGIIPAYSHSSGDSSSGIGTDGIALQASALMELSAGDPVPFFSW